MSNSGFPVSFFLTDTLHCPFHSQRRGCKIGGIIPAIFGVIGQDVLEDTQNPFVLCLRVPVARTFHDPHQAEEPLFRVAGAGFCLDEFGKWRS